MDASCDMAITGWDTGGEGERIPLESPAIWHMLRIPLQHLLWDMANVARDNAQNLVGYGNHGLGYGGKRGRIPLESLAIWHMLRFVHNNCGGAWPIWLWTTHKSLWDMATAAWDTGAGGVSHWNRQRFGTCCEISRQLLWGMASAVWDNACCLCDA